LSLSEIRIDAPGLQGNLAALKALQPPNGQICAVVKGNAYGHGLEQVVRALEGRVDYFQVDDLQELRDLREITRTRALVLGYVAEDELGEAMALGCELAVFDQEHLGMVGSTARSIGHGFVQPIHLKIDALLGRLGTLPHDVSRVTSKLSEWPELALEAIYAHFANIEDTTDLTHAEAQRDLLGQVERSVQQDGLSIRSHISATSGLMTVEGAQPRSLVRLGIGIYGMYPSGPLARTHQEIGLRPVLTWATKLAQVKTLPAKHPIGYGLTYVTRRPTKIGIVPQGYSDGYDRGLSNSGEVLVRGVRCPVLGRIAMNMFAIDLTEVADARREDEVVLIGEQGRGQIFAEELAAPLGTINYEITSRISPLIPRVLC
jgi:alanine racemase